MKKAFSIIKNLINIFIVICVILFLLMVCLQRFTDNEISFFNYRMFTVASGSMAPEYEVGDVLIARETPPEKIKVGDSITYKGQQGTFAGKIVTHSVTRIEKDENGQYIFHTKGIANLIEDPPVYEKQVYGVIVWKPILMSIIYKIINTKYGLFLFVVLPIFYIIGSEMLSSMLEQEEKRRNKMKQEKEEKEEKEEEEKNTENESYDKKEEKVETENQEENVTDETNEDNNDNKETIINAEEIKEETTKEVTEENNKEETKKEKNKEEITKKINKEHKENTEEKNKQEVTKEKNTNKNSSSVKKKNNKKKQYSNK